MHKKIYTLLFLFASVVAVAQKQNPVNLKEGQVINVKMEMNQNTEMGQGIMMKMNTMSTSRMNVQKINPNGILVSNQITRITTNIDGMGQNQSLDSDKKEDMDSAEEGIAIKDMLEAVNYYNIDKTTGQFTSADKDGKATVEAKDEDQTAMMQMGAGALNDVTKMKSFIVVFPVNVKPGYSWIDSSEVNGIKTITTNTVNKLDNGIAYLDIKGTTAGATKMNMQGQDIDVKLNGTFTGNGEVNTKTNLSKKQVINSELISTIDMMGQTMDMTTKGTTTLTFD